MEKGIKTTGSNMTIIKPLNGKILFLPLIKIKHEENISE